MAVKRVLRRKAEAVHYMESSLEVGSSVQVELDWARRIDHMQQHSGGCGIPTPPLNELCLKSAMFYRSTFDHCRS